MKARTGPARDATSEEALRKEVQGSARFDALMAAKARPLGETRPSIESSLWEHSLILFDGEKFTIVPEGSILHLPEAHLSKVIAKPGGDFLYWPNFLKRNATWLAAKEVPLAMSRGDAKLAQAVLKEVSTDKRVLVAVFKGGPIMILEPETASDGVDTTTRKGQPSENRR